MKFHIITIFPEAFESFLSTSIISKVKNRWVFEIALYKLNEFAKDTSGHVDDKAFGMHWQVLTPLPLSRAIESIFEVFGKMPVIYMSPSWKTLSQEQVEDFSIELKECIIICGHYEGIDQRIIDIFVNHEVSIWEYILTWGELAAQVFIDSIVRLLPEALWNSISHEEESFSSKLDRQKEYPVYTRPRDFRGHIVPDILTSGNHKEIEKWKYNNLR